LNVRLLRARRKLREQVERTCRACATHGCLDCDCG
ncbi:MAG TPA: RNA polymerase subunit sigma-70, partial [Verrucomicrobiales bacterium]|nr:RNA polymerase subunit sigma-70 [Verrucomicrobiales bacterium]